MLGEPGKIYPKWNRALLNAMNPRGNSLCVYLIDHLFSSVVNCVLEREEMWYSLLHVTINFFDLLSMLTILSHDFISS